MVASGGVCSRLQHWRTPLAVALTGGPPPRTTATASGGSPLGVRHTRAHLSSSRSQNRSVSARHPVARTARSSASAAAATHVTGAECPLSVPSLRPESSHSRTSAPWTLTAWVAPKSSTAAASPETAHTERGRAGAASTHRAAASSERRQSRRRVRVSTSTPAERPNKRAWTPSHTERSASESARRRASLRASMQIERVSHASITSFQQTVGSSAHAGRGAGDEDVDGGSDPSSTSSPDEAEVWCCCARGGAPSLPSPSLEHLARGFGDDAAAAREEPSLA
mmetsp:Transcript_29541/g.96209  ORF Transcript_29541/g.96209 Transcript_29541/m.96209 type:complete len:281 (-) Transcript_29541:281-1123(-)